MELSILIFMVFISIILGVSIYASRNQKNATSSNYFIDRTLNWFLIAFSAGTTANTGFIVTGAVGMGYTMGISSLLLPFSWFLGDLAFWYLFPQKINEISRSKNIITISEFLTYDLEKGKAIVKLVCSVILVFAALTYTIAQWAASSVTFTGFYGLSPWQGIIITGVLVTSYCIIGGFRSSVRVDIVQGSFMIALTVIGLLLCLLRIENLPSKLYFIINQFSDNFSWISSIGFIAGWAFASLGFGLSQPHIIDKYFAGRDENEIRKARWTYLVFVQLTWAGMTFVGVLIKFVIPNLANNQAETALPILIDQYSNQLLKGIVVCGVFATIASSAGSLLIATSNYIKNDILSYFITGWQSIPNRLLVIIVSSITLLITLYLQNSTVFDLAIFAILLGGVIAPAMIVKIFKINNNVYSICCSLIVALLTTLLWKAFGYDQIINQTIIGILFGLMTNFLVYMTTNNK